MKVICLLILILYTSLVLSNKLKINNEKEQHSGHSCGSHNQCCPKYENCLFYHVITDTYSGYGKFI